MTREDILKDLREQISTKLELDSEWKKICYHLFEIALCCKTIVTTFIKKAKEKADEGRAEIGQ